MFRLLTDFNNIQNGAVVGLPEDAEGPRPLRVGDRVLLHDGGEHEAWGKVTHVAAGLLGVKVDMTTWADAGTYRASTRNGFLIVTNWSIPTTDAVKGWGSVAMPTRRSLVRSN